jgi:hypothetical protein
MRLNAGTSLANEQAEERIQAVPTLMDASPNKRCPMLGAVTGAILGLVLGIAQLIYIGSWDFFYWGYMPMIPLYSALGWALYGMTVGGSGIFDVKEPAPKRKQSRVSGFNTAKWQRTHV